MRPYLIARLSGLDTVKVGQHVRLEFSLTNLGQGDWYVLTWYTPLEGLQSSCLKVLRDGRPIEYDGIMMKRGRPGSQDYVLVRSGATVTRAFDLDSAYSIAGRGEYVVELDARIRNCVPAIDHHRPYPAPQELDAEPVSVPLGEARHVFRVVGEGRARKTAGLSAREAT